MATSSRPTRSARSRGPDPAAAHQRRLREGERVMDRRRDRAGAHGYARTARVNALLREVVAEALERLSDHDDRLRLVTVTGVEVDPDLRRARVFLASLPE